MASIAVVGSGFVGQANGKALVKFGHSLIFSDTDPVKVALLQQEGYRAVAPEALEQENIDIFFVCVPTPTTSSGTKLTFIQDAAKLLGIGPLRHLKHYPVVVIKSTVPPGTTDGVIRPLLEQYSGKKAGVDFGLTFEPEYLRERTSTLDAEKPRLILIGSGDPHAASLLAWLRAPFRVPIKHVSIIDAETQKYVHNLFNANKISFFNELRQVTQRLGVDTDTVFALTMETAEAAWNPRYGIRDFGPFNGSCLPKDTAAFLAFAKDTLGMGMPILSAVIEANHALEKQKLDQLSKTAPFLPAMLKDTPLPFSVSPPVVAPSK